MKRLIVLTSLFMCTLTILPVLAGYQVGDVATDFKLKNIDGKMVSLSDYPESKGFIVIFTCNHCPYAVMYEDRIIELQTKFAAQGYPVVAINPNSANKQPKDSYANMITRAEEKSFNFPYLHDETQAIAKAYGATRTPHIYLLQRQGEDLKVAYIGAIDDNARKADDVEARYLEDAITALESGAKPDPDFTKAVGCTIKWE